MKKHTHSYPVLLSIVAILSAMTIFPAIAVSAADLYLNQPLNGIYATESGGIITQSGCVVSPDANVVLIANHFSFQPGFQVPTGSSLTTLFSGDDADVDGLNNYQEFIGDTDPFSADTDNDGMPDGWEVNHNLNPLIDDTSGDPDGDGLSNLQEFSIGSDPFVWNPDNDSDGLPDAWELQYFSDISHTGSEDTDGDGVSNAIELQMGKNPAQNDLHGAGVYYQYDSAGRIKTVYQVPGTQ